MSRLNITYHPIGIVHSPFHSQEGTAIQAAATEDVQAKIEILYYNDKTRSNY
ncbi:MAG: hypothetical protein GZ094_22150 [Mariniphaga sp.]|nr:hypothetical protein [Mariniphaga sp.]